MTDYKSVNEKVGGRASIVAVSKFHPYEAVVEAYNEGAMIFGENRVQEMRDKFPPKNERPEGMKVYLIGQLQRNKVRKALEWCDRIESVDSIPLIDKIEKECEAMDISIDILLEFNSSGEEQKSGFRTEAELLSGVTHILEDCPRVIIRGVMTVGPLGHDDEKNREAFQKTASLYEQVRKTVPSADTLSMGMSGDWETALLYGSTEVRIGTAIFGERDYPAKP